MTLARRDQGVRTHAAVAADDTRPRPPVVPLGQRCDGGRGDASDESRGRRRAPARARRQHRLARRVARAATQITARRHVARPTARRVTARRVTARPQRARGRGGRGPRALRPPRPQ